MMSRTDKTTPYRVVARGGRCECLTGYPCVHVSVTARLAVYTRKATRKSRTRLRLDLAAGREPLTNQHRHSAKWEAW